MIQSRTNFIQSNPSLIFTVNASSISCSIDDVLKEPNQTTVIEVTQELIKKNTGQTSRLQVTPKTLDMSIGYFDQAKVSNCSLSLFSLT